MSGDDGIIAGTVDVSYGSLLKFLIHIIRCCHVYTGYRCMKCECSHCVVISTIKCKNRYVIVGSRVWGESFTLYLEWRFGSTVPGNAWNLTSKSQHFGAFFGHLRTMLITYCSVAVCIIVALETRIGSNPAILSWLHDLSTTLENFHPPKPAWFPPRPTQVGSGVRKVSK